MTDLELGSNAGDDAGLISGRPTAPVAAQRTTPGKIAMMTLGSVAALFMVMGFFGESSSSSQMVRVQAVDPTSLASVPDMPSKDEAKEHLKNAHAAASKHISKALESKHAKKATKHAKAAWSSVTNWWSETTGLEEVEAEEKKGLKKAESKKSDDKKEVEKKSDDKGDDKQVQQAATESSWYSGMTMSLREKRRRKEMARRSSEKKQHESVEEQKDKPKINVKDAGKDVVNGGWGMIPSWDAVTGWFN